MGLLKPRLAATVMTWEGSCGSALIALYWAAGSVRVRQVPPENLATPVLWVTYRSPLDASAARFGWAGLPASRLTVPGLPRSVDFMMALLAGSPLPPAR